MFLSTVLVLLGFHLLLWIFSRKIENTSKGASFFAYLFLAFYVAVFRLYSKPAEGEEASLFVELSNIYMFITGFVWYFKRIRAQN